MLKNTLFSVLFIFLLFFCYTQEEIEPITPQKFDGISISFFELYPVDFDVYQKAGCEYLITQLINLTNQPLEDSLSFIWNVFKDSISIFFVFTDENPDIFLHEVGNYHVKLKITNKNGDTDSLTKYNIISIDKMPQINFTYSPEDALFAEFLGEVEFINLTDPELEKDTSMIWYWDMGDNVINSTDWSPVHLFSSWGDYYTTFHLKTKNGCNVAMTKTVIIEDELFFPKILYKDNKNSTSIFAVTNLNTNISENDPNEFRTNYLFIYNEKGEIKYEQKNYDSYKKNDIVVEGIHVLNANSLDEGSYYYSFYYKGRNKMVHYNGEFRVN